MHPAHERKRPQQARSLHWSSVQSAGDRRSQAEGSRDYPHEAAAGCRGQGAQGSPCRQPDQGREEKWPHGLHTIHPQVNNPPFSGRRLTRSSYPGSPPQSLHVTSVISQLDLPPAPDNVRETRRTSRTIRGACSPAGTCFGNVVETQHRRADRDVTIFPEVKILNSLSWVFSARSDVTARWWSSMAPIPLPKAEIEKEPIGERTDSMLFAVPSPPSSSLYSLLIFGLPAD